MTEDAFEVAAQVLAARAGHSNEPATRGRLRHAVIDEAARHGLDVDAYVATLRHDRRALQDLLNRVTVQETSFFRDPGQFAVLARHVLPRLAATGERVQIWSAGCANGQEAYSIAIALAESGIADWQVIATDISTDALRRARAGRYGAREITGLSDARRRRFLVAAPNQPGHWDVHPTLRDRVEVVRQNLSADPPPFPRGTCQVVFCRNVLIYFNRHDVLAVLAKISEWLPPDGDLFLGYSESLWQVTDLFELVRLDDSFVYRNTPAGSVPRPPASAPRRRPPRPAVTPPTPPGRPRVPPPAAPRSEPPGASGAPGASDASPEPAPAVASLLRDGEEALARGDHAAAIGAFRQATYVDHDHPVAYLDLGLALEAAGDPDNARRAYRAGRAALERCDTEAVEATLEGYRLEELTRLLDRKANPK